MGSQDSIYYSVYKNPAVIPGLAFLKQTTNNDFLLNIVSKERQFLRNRPDSFFYSNTDLVLSNQYFSKDRIKGESIIKIKRLVPYKKYVETFFAEYLGLKVIYSPLGIRLIIKDPYTNFFNLRFILESLMHVMSKDNFIDYNNFTDYNGFSESVILNLLLCGRWGAKVDDFLVAYCLLLIRNPFTKFLFRNNDFSDAYSRYSPYESFGVITTKARESGDRELFWRTLESTRLSINGIISNSNLPTNKKANLRKSSAYLVKKLRGG